MQSRIYSVLDLLYKGYTQKRRACPRKKKQISQCNLENLLYAIIEKLLQREEFTAVDGMTFRAQGTVQAARGARKKYPIPLTRLRTDGSGEEKPYRTQYKDHSLKPI